MGNIDQLIKEQEKANEWFEIVVKDEEDYEVSIVNFAVPLELGSKVFEAAILYKNPRTEVTEKHELYHNALSNESAKNALARIKENPAKYF